MKTLVMMRAVSALVLIGAATHAQEGPPQPIEAPGSEDEGGGESSDTPAVDEGVVSSAETEPTLEEGSEPDPEPESGSEQQTESEQETESELGSEQETEPEQETGLGPEPESEAEPEQEPESNTETRTEAPEPAKSQDSGSADEAIKLQKPFARQGEFFALGAHVGLATADDDDYGWRKPSMGPAFTLRLGEAIVDYADIGIEFGLGLHGGEEKLTSGRIVAHGRLYPLRDLFIQGGFGFGFAGGPDPEDDAFKRFRYGDVYVLGVGTNLYLGDENKSGGPVASPVMTLEVGPDRELTTAVLWLGVELSYFAGLRRTQLDLPIDDAYQRAPAD